MVSLSPHDDVSFRRAGVISGFPLLYSWPPEQGRACSRCSGNVCGVNLLLLLGSKFCPRISELGVPLEVSGSMLSFCAWGTEAQRRAQSASSSPYPGGLAGVCPSLSPWPEGRSCASLAGTCPRREPSRAWGSGIPRPSLSAGTWFFSSPSS